MALNSSSVSAGDLAKSQQYNDLRNDVVSTSSGHVHNGVLGIGSAQFILNVAGAPLLLQNTTDQVSSESLRIAGGNRSTPADNDEVFIAAYLDINTGVQTEFGRITHKALDVTTCTKDSRWEFQQYTANTLREVAIPAVTADDTFAMVTLAQTLAGKTLSTPTIGATDWANANHAHTAANSGGTLAAGIDAASAAEQITGSVASKYVSPATQQFHRSAVKFWVQDNTSSNTANGSYNIYSVLSGSAGIQTVTIANDLACGCDSVYGGASADPPSAPHFAVTCPAVGSFIVQIRNNSHALTDSVYFAFGLGNLA